MTNLKLQKLLYYADAWYLALRNRALFSEPFRAWVHGPVLLSQYHRFKAHQWRPILDDIVLPELDADAKAHLDETIEVFGIESAIALEQMTHEEAPWLEARGGLGPDDRSGAIISKETTADYYRAFAEEEES